MMPIKNQEQDNYYGYSELEELCFQPGDYIDEIEEYIKVKKVPPIGEEEKLGIYPHSGPLAEIVQYSSKESQSRVISLFRWVHKNTLTPISKVSSKGYPFIYKALRRELYKIAHFLIVEAKVDINSFDQTDPKCFGQTSLYYVLTELHEKTMKKKLINFLIERGADPTMQVIKEGSSSKRYLFELASDNQKILLRKSKKYGSKMQALEKKISNGPILNFFYAMPDYLSQSLFSNKDNQNKEGEKDTGSINALKYKKNL